MKLGILEEDSIEGNANQTGAIQDSVVALRIMVQLKAKADSLAIKLRNAEFVERNIKLESIQIISDNPLPPPPPPPPTRSTPSKKTKRKN